MRRWFPPLCTLALGAALAPGPAGATTIVVDTLLSVNASDGLCSLREAIVAANTDAPSFDCPGGSGSSDRIRLSVSGTIELATALPTITDGLAIEGPGRDLLAIDGMDLVRPLGFLAAEDRWLVLRGLTVRNGAGGCFASTSSAGSVALVDMAVRDCATTGSGGGANVVGNLWIERTTFDNNSAAPAAVGGGGALSWTGGGDLTILSSTFSGNRSTGPSGIGGAIRIVPFGSTPAAVRIVSSTFSGNGSNHQGGALGITGGTGTVLSVVLLDSTLYGNESDLDANSALGTGGTIYAVSTSTADVALQFQNSIVAGGIDHASSSPCDEMKISLAPAGAVVTHGFNVIGDESCVETEFPASPGGGVANANGDFVGTIASPLDPRLGALAANGGPTETHLPLTETPHPVIDQGECSEAELDQRGHGEAGTGQRARNIAAVPDNPAGDGCDVGAVEFNATPQSGSLVFADDFESGSTLFWSAEGP